MSGFKVAKKTGGAPAERRPPSVESAPPPVETQADGPIVPRREPVARKKSAGQNPAPKSPAAKPTRKKPAGRHWLGTVLRWGVGLCVWGLIMLAGLVGWFAWDMPRIDEVEALRRHPSVTIIAGDGTTFARMGQLGGEAVALEDLPAYVPQAILAVEDQRFYWHPGIDPLGLARAAWVNFQAGRVVQGGSTLTQQLAKNLFLTTDRTIRRKVQEALLAVWLDWTYEKNDILAAYLNRVYLGGGAYGVNAAALRYFDKPASRLSVREAAVIAGLLKAPSRYAPTNDPDLARDRSDVVLGLMLDEGYLTTAQYQQARAEPVLAPKQGVGRNSGWVADWVAEQAWQLAGVQDRDIVARTTLDPTLQAVAEKHVTALLSAKAQQAKVGQAALVAMAPDGAVKALVGGRDYSRSSFNRATDARRQPGSSFKPFIYLAALASGRVTPDSLVEDSPVSINGYAPRNYDGRFRGPIDLRKALAESVNTVALRLLYQSDIDRVLSLTRSLGLTAPLNRDLSLALGTSEMTLLDLTGLYAALAHGARPAFPYVVTEIRDRSGALLYRRRPPELPPPVAPAAALSDLIEMMAGVIDNGTGKRAKLDRPAAGKTGTTNDYRDALFAGFTADLVAAVWLGNDDNSPTDKVTGGSLPADLWRDFMLEAHRGLPARPLPGLMPAEVRVPTQTVQRTPTPPPTANAPAPAALPPVQKDQEQGFGSLLRRLLGN